MGILHLPQTYKSAFLIDGQHRIYGYTAAKSDSNHTIPVVAFHNLPVEEQAKIFVDINHTQKSVPANLLHSIMAEFHWDSSNDKEALNALKTRLFDELNSDERSPFYKRLILSEEKKTDTRCLTLQTLKSWGLNRVDLFGKLKGNKLIKTGFLSDITHEKTLTKASDFFRITFSKIEEELPDQWELGSAPGGFIAMNIGISALIRIFDSIIEYKHKYADLHPEELTGGQLADEVIPYLKPIINFVKKLDGENIKKFRGLFGSGATEKVVREFQREINSKFPNYSPLGLEQWIIESSGKFNDSARDLGYNHIEPMIDSFIKGKLQEEFEEDESQWWIRGVPKKIQIKCSEAKIENGSVEPDWNFLNTIHYYDIIGKHWKLLGDSLTKPGDENLKKADRIAWLQKFNSIRQKYSHPQREHITEEEHAFLSETKVWLGKIFKSK